MKERINWQNDLSYTAVVAKRERRKKNAAESRSRAKGETAESVPSPSQNTQEIPAITGSGEGTPPVDETSSVETTSTTTTEAAPAQETGTSTSTAQAGGGSKPPEPPQNSPNGGQRTNHDSSHVGGHHKHGGFLSSAGGVLSQLLLIPLGLGLSAMSYGWNALMSVFGQIGEVFTGKSGGGGKKKSGGGGGHDHGEHH